MQSPGSPGISKHIVMVLEMKLSNAQVEIDSINREFMNGDYTADEHMNALEGVLKRHSARIEVIKTYANGIQKIRVLDVNNDIVAEYHQAAPKI